MPPPRKRTAPAAKPATDIQALRDEVAAEQPVSAKTKYIAVPLADTVVRVIEDFWEWPAVTNDLIAVGRFTQAAGQIVHPVDFKTTWVAVNPTNGQVRDFMVEIEKVIGIPLATLLTSLSS